MALKVEHIYYDELTADEKNSGLSNNGNGKDYAGYLRVTYNGETLYLASDAMEPEDCRFGRDLGWIKGLLMQCYELGKQESK